MLVRSGHLVLAAQREDAPAASQPQRWRVASGACVVRLGAPGARAGDVMLDDVQTSKQHARLLRVEDGSWCVTDLKSLNKTIVNAEKLVPDVPSRPLREGDRVYVGQYWLSVASCACDECVSSAAPAAAVPESAESVAAPRVAASAAGDVSGPSRTESAPAARAGAPPAVPGAVVSACAAVATAPIRAAAPAAAAIEIADSAESAGASRVAASAAGGVSGPSRAESAPAARAAVPPAVSAAAVSAGATAAIAPISIDESSSEHSSASSNYSSATERFVSRFRVLSKVSAQSNGKLVAEAKQGDIPRAVGAARSAARGKAEGRSKQGKKQGMQQGKREGKEKSKAPKPASAKGLGGCAPETCYAVCGSDLGAPLGEEQVRHVLSCSSIEGAGPEHAALPPASQEERLPKSGKRLHAALTTRPFNKGLPFDIKKCRRRLEDVEARISRLETERDELRAHISKTMRLDKAVAQGPDVAIGDALLSLGEAVASTRSSASSSDASVTVVGEEQHTRGAFGAAPSTPPSSVFQDEGGEGSEEEEEEEEEEDACKRQRGIERRVRDPRRLSRAMKAASSGPISSPLAFRAALSPLRRAQSTAAAATVATAAAAAPPSSSPPGPGAAPSAPPPDLEALAAMGEEELRSLLGEFGVRPEGRREEMAAKLVELWRALRREAAPPAPPSRAAELTLEQRATGLTRLICAAFFKSLRNERLYEKVLTFQCVDFAVLEAAVASEVSATPGARPVSQGQLRAFLDAQGVTYRV